MVEYKNKIVNVTDMATQKFIWLRRICGGFIELTDKKLKNVSQAKQKEVLNLLSGELLSSSVVVYCNFVKEIIHLKRLLRNNGIECEVIFGQVQLYEREERIEAFQGGQVRVLICQPEIVKHGIDFSKADAIIYYSSPVGLETRLQSEDRPIDVSKNDSLLVIDLICERTVEETIYNSLIKKETRQEMIRNIVQDLQKETV